MTDAEQELRASDSDRIAMEIELSLAYQEGRLELFELDQRVERIRQAQTYRDLSEVIVGLAAAQRRLEHLLREARHSPRTGCESPTPRSISSPDLAFFARHPRARVVLAALSVPLLLGMVHIAVAVPVIAVVLYALVICSVFFTLTALTANRRPANKEH